MDIPNTKNSSEENSILNTVIDNIYLILIFIIIIIYFILIIINIRKYFENILLYNASLYLKLNIYENKYNYFNVINPLIILIIYLIIGCLICYYLYLYYYNKVNNEKLLSIDYFNSLIILGIILLIIIINIIILILYINNSYYFENELNNKKINYLIYSNIDGVFLNFMYKRDQYGNDDKNISIEKTLEDYIKEYKNGLIKDSNNLNNQNNIINNRLKILISYKLNKDYINSKNIDIINNINNIVSKNTDLFSYLLINENNILSPLQPNDNIIDKILKPFISGPNVIYNIKNNYDFIKKEIKNRYYNLQNETNMNINIIKKNTDNMLCHIYMMFSIISIIIISIFIILYLIILYYKNIKKININIYDTIIIIFDKIKDSIINIVKIFKILFVSP